MSDSARPERSGFAWSLEKALEEIDHARAAFLARAGQAPGIETRVSATSGETGVVVDGGAGFDRPAPDDTSQEAAPPETADPEVADPEVAGPEVAGPEVAGREIAGPEIAGDGFDPADLTATNHYRNAAYTPRPYAAPGAADDDPAQAIREPDAETPASPLMAGTGGGLGHDNDLPGGGGSGGAGSGGGAAGGSGGSGNGGNGSGWGRRALRMNPFSGPGRVDPTIQFVQTAIHARPEQTEEILAAALRISPDQAERIILAAVRANPGARAQILRIARSSGALGAKSALSLLVALFLFEVFGLGNNAEAKEELEAARRSSATESFATWFTTAAVALAILFDANAIQALARYLNIDEDADFGRLVDKIADLPEVEAATVAAFAGELGFDVVARDIADDDGSAYARGAGNGIGSLPLGGLETLGGLGDETLARGALEDGGSHRFADPDLSNGLLQEAGQLNLLGDETSGDLPPPDPDEEETPPEMDPPAPPDPDSAGAGDIAASEGDGVAVFTITRSSGEGEAAVSFATVDGSAVAGQDYAATTGTVHFAEGETAVTVTVALIDDQTIEPTESFQLVLSDPDNLVLEDTVATATILDNEAADLTWSVTGTQLVTEGDAAAYTIAFDGGPLAPGQEASVRLRLSLPGGPGGAEAEDFSAAFLAEVQAAIDALGPDAGIRLDGDRLVFVSGGPASLTLYLDTADDGLVEGPENYTLVIEDPSAGDVAPGDGLVTTAIEDDDAGSLRWHLDGNQLADEGGAATYRVTVDGAELAAGRETSVGISLNLPGGPGGADAADLDASVAAAIGVAIDALGPDGGVRFEDGRLIFEGGGPGELVFTVPIAEDGLVEGPENFTLLLSAPSDGSIPPADALVTTVISDNDTDGVSWRLSGDAFVTEGDGAGYTLHFDGADLGAGQEASITLSLDLPGGPDGAEAADLRQALTEALQAAIDDLGPDAGIRLDGDRVVFSAGAPRSLAFRLDTENDRLVERAEGFRLSLAAPSVGTVAAAAVLTVIRDEDADALVWRLTGDQLTGEGGAPSYRIALADGEIAGDLPVSIDLAINLPSGSGGAGSADFSEGFYKDIQDAIDGMGPNAGVSLSGTTLVFSAGFGGSFDFTLPTADDLLAEGAENFTVVLGTPSAGTVDAAHRLVTTAILDNDGPTPVTGTANGETLTGDDGPNDMSGLAGDDRLIGEGGDDILRGGPGADELQGGPGADRLDGGSGADRFVVSAVDLGDGIDRIVDFRPEDGDSLHVLDLLTGFETTMVDIDAFIRFQERTDGTAIQFDTDGEGSGAHYVDAILLEAVHGLTVDQLMADNHLTVG